MSRMAREETRSAWLFLAPSLLLFAVFVVLPVVAAFGISFTSWDLFTTAHFAGLDNYRQLLFEDKLFHKVLGNTAVYVVGTVPVQMILALGVALLLNRGVWGQNALRVIYFLPVVSSTVAVALIWSWIFNSNFGVLNALLSALGVQDLPGWLNSSKVGAARADHCRHLAGAGLLDGAVSGRTAGHWPRRLRGGRT